MHPLSLTSDELVRGLLAMSETEHVTILDSCGARHLGSHLLIAGIRPVRTVRWNENDPARALRLFDDELAAGHAAIFTISYDLGRKMLGLTTGPSDEPDIFVSLFDKLIVHDYTTAKTFICGSGERSIDVEEQLIANRKSQQMESIAAVTTLTSNFTRDNYCTTIETIKDLIRSGETYQTNLTQQISAVLPADLSPQTVFDRLRRDHPAPFAAFIQRDDTTVISASPERFFRINDRAITTSPIKGTRPRGNTSETDAELRLELLNSPKDRAENTMIVDLLRNDLGRVCEFGSVEVEKLCEIEEHPSLFHMVSTVKGHLRPNVKMSDVLTALFPCGSITGAPKISTMRIIDQIEPTPRGLSMGAIGYSVPDGFGIEPVTDLSVAIRTMVIKDSLATFNVGGGIVIDSDPDSEYEETLTKATALLAALGMK